jgi:hypothetical protein
MAQQRGSAATIIFDTETTYKTTPAAPDAVLLPFKSESIALDRALVDSATLRSSRQPQQPIRGAVNVGGDISIELAPQYGRLLKHIFGGYGVAGAAAPYTHTYTIGDLPVGMLIEKAFLDLATDKFFQYSGCKIGSFKVSGKSSGPVDCSVTIMGAKETIATSSFDGTATDLGHTPFDGMSATVKQGGSTLGIATSVDLTLDNSLDGDTYVMDGTGTRYSMPEGQAKVSGKLTTLFESTTLYELAIANTESSLELAFALGAGTGATVGAEKLTFYIDELIFKPKSPTINGPKGLVVDLDFIGYFNNGSGSSAMRAVLLTPTATF